MKASFLRISGTLKALRMVETICAAAGLGLDELAGPAGGLDPLAGRLGELVGVDGELLVELAAAEDLDRDVALRVARPGALERGEVDGRRRRRSGARGRRGSRAACASGTARTASTSSCSGRAACASACGAGSGRPRSGCAASRPSASRSPCGRGRRSCRARSRGRGRCACGPCREPSAGLRLWRPMSSGLSSSAITSPPRSRGDGRRGPSRAAAGSRDARRTC